MVFYGWGKSSQEWVLNDGNRLVYAYKYFSLMFLFKVAYSKKWYVLGDGRHEEMTRCQLEERYSDAPKPGLWGQYGLPMAVVAIVLFAAVSSLF